MPVVQKNEVFHLCPTGRWTRKYQDPQTLRSAQTLSSPYKGYKHVAALQAQISLAYFCSLFCLFVSFIGFAWIILSPLDSCKD